MTRGVKTRVAHSDELVMALAAVEKTLPERQALVLHEARRYILELTSKLGGARAVLDDLEYKSL